MPRFEILVPGPFRRDQVQVGYTGLRPLWEDDDRRAIEREWRARRRRARREGIPLFSGPLWGVRGHRLDGAGGLCLTLGPTSYREYVGTRVAGFFGSRPKEALASPLAVCAAIVTSDDCIVVARRQGVDVARGQYHVVGGFVERGRDADPFAAIAREAEEELGLALDPDRLLCLGLVYDRLHPHFELCFAARIDIPFSKLTELDPYEVEATQLESVLDTREAVAAFITNHHQVTDLSPTGEACLSLYLQLGLS